MEQIRAIFEELNFPSGPRLRRVLQNRGIAFNAAQVDQLARGESVRQVQAPELRLKGKISSAFLNDLWMADLIDLTQAPSRTDKLLRDEAEDDKYILVVQDVFSRKLWTVAMADKSAVTTLAAWEAILEEVGEQPRSLTTDGGPEFRGAFDAALGRQGIKHTWKDNLRQIATIDSAINTLKKALVRDMRNRQTSDWSDRIEKVTKGQNQGPNEPYLKGYAPDDVEDDPQLQDVLEIRNKSFVEINRFNLREREAKLRIAGFFRVLENRQLRLRRGWKPRWSARIYEVLTVDFDHVYAIGGEKFKTKFVLPIEGATPDGGPIGLELEGSVQVDTKNRRIFRSFALRVLDHYGVGRTLSLRDLRTYLDSLALGRSFQDAAIEARAQSTNPVLALTKAFPEMFRTFKVNDRWATTILGPPKPAPNELPAPAVPAASPAAPVASAAPVEPDARPRGPLVPGMRRLRRVAPA
jgi:hypothetical protein